MQRGQEVWQSENKLRLCSVPLELLNWVRRFVSMMALVLVDFPKVCRLGFEKVYKEGSKWGFEKVLGNQ